MYFCYRFKLTELPDNILVSIFKLFDLQFLLQVVNRTCKRLHSLIEENSILWRFFEFDIELAVKSSDLERILQHSSCFRRFLLPRSNFEIQLPNTIIEGSLERCRYLYWLDLSDSTITSLSFLRKTPELEVLDLTGCKLLHDSEFLEIHNCTKLDHLFLSFTNITPYTFVAVASKQNLITLDGCGIELNVSQCKRILKENCRHLQYFSLSLAASVNHYLFESEITSVFCDCQFNIYKL